MKKLAAVLLTALLIVFCFTACDNGGNETENNDGKVEQTIEVAEIALNKQQLILQEGSEETLTATVTPDNADKTVIWTSSDDKIVKVDNGKVTAVSCGTATVTAKAGEKTATCTVTVEQAKVEFTGVWNFYKFVTGGNSYIIGVDDEKMKEDLNIEDSLIISESYKIVLNADGTAVYTEEWGPVDCRWTENGDTVSLIVTDSENVEIQITLQFVDGCLACINEEDALYFKK